MHSQHIMYSDEITDLGDQIEGTQDNLRQTLSQTKSQLSSIQTNVVQREIQLKNELSDLERRLETLKQDAINVSKERDTLNKSIDKEVRDIKRQTQKELNALKAESLKEKKDITRTQRWELESRLQKAQLDQQPSRAALQEEKNVKPTLPSLKDALQQIQSKFTPRIDDLKEQKNAKQMFFDTSWTNLKKEKKDEINVAKDVYENEMKEEDELLRQKRVSYVDQLYNKEEELQRSQDQLAEPVELFGVSAISDALKQRERLLQEKDDAISNQQEEWTRTMKDAAESLIAIQDEYDAKLENAQRNLKREEIRTERELMKQDKKKSSRRIQLIYEREELTRSLSQLMVDERESAKSEYQTLKKTKSDTLAKNLEQVQSTNNEIQVLRSKMVYVQQELNMLENTSRKAHVKLEELEDERGSFRKQLKRSVKVAVGKIPLIGSKVRE